MHGWQVRNDAWYHWYVKLLRAPGQDRLVPQKVRSHRVPSTVSLLPEPSCILSRFTAVLVQRLCLAYGAQPFLVLQMQWHLSRPYYARKSFPQTWQAYELALHRLCGQPCERVRQHGGAMSAGDIAALAEYNLCDVCGMDIIEKDMLTCKSCQDLWWKTKACDVCVPARKDNGSGPML